MNNLLSLRSVRTGAPPGAASPPEAEGLEVSSPVTQASQLDGREASRTGASKDPSEIVPLPHVAVSQAGGEPLDVVPSGCSAVIDGSNRYINRGVPDMVGEGGAHATAGGHRTDCLLCGGATMCVAGELAWTQLMCRIQASATRCREMQYHVAQRYG